MTAIDKDGNIITKENGAIAEVFDKAALEQNFISEVRCTQGTFVLSSSFGKNPAVWYLSQSPNDRITDLIRISENYLVLKSVEFVNGIYEVTA